VHQALMDLVWVLAKTDQVITPLLAERLRQDVLDRQLGVVKVDLLWMTIALLKPFEDERALRAAPAEVERAGADCLTELLVGWPVAARPGQFPPHRLGEAFILGELGNELDE
jgi:hypothetical protein